MARKKKAKRVAKKAAVKKEDKGLFDALAAGTWIDRMTDSWGKPKSYNKDWNKGME